MGHSLSNQASSLVRVKPWESYKVYQDEGLIEALAPDELNRVSIIQAAEESQMLQFEDERIIPPFIMPISSADSVRDAGKKSVRFEEDYKHEEKPLKFGNTLSIKDPNRQLLMMHAEVNNCENLSTVSK